MPEYGLLIKNAHLIDPDSGVNSRLDIAIRDGRIARIAADIPLHSAPEVVDAATSMISAGWIDLHAHPSDALVSFGLHPDEIGIKQGVTAINDAGSAGYANFEVMRRYVIPSAHTGVFCFLHISPVGEVILPEIGYESFDRDSFLKIVEANRDIIKGIKMRVIAEVVNFGVDVTALARGLSVETGLPVMVHIGTVPNGQATDEAITAFTRNMLSQLQKGDIVTHAFTPKLGWIFDRAGNPLPEVKDALERGVHLDIGSAHAHFSFQTARAALGRGFAPFTLSTDLTALTHNKADKLSLSLVMSEFMALGFSLQDVIRMVTSRPALILGEAEKRGSLREGLLADLTIFRVEEGEYAFSDVRAGNMIEGKVLLVPEKTIKDGTVYECNKE